MKNGRVHDLFVCDDCAQPKGKAPRTLSLADIMFSFGQSNLSAHKGVKREADQEKPAKEPLRDATPSPPAGAAVCGFCGMTAARLLESQRFGCAGCYDAFPVAVQEFVEELQYGDEHAGKMPPGRLLADAASVLKGRIREALAAQDFETAAQLHEELRVVERARSKKASNGKA
jgi:protein arginine kinase activator